MKRLLDFGGWLLLCVFLAAGARADQAHQPVFFEGRIGPYSGRVSIRLPGVIPGLAEITVRVAEGSGVTNVLALPIKWNAGRKGAPAPDPAVPVKGEAGLYSVELWFMESGAHVVEVTLEGAQGAGRVMVPVNATATRVLGLSRGLGAALAVLGLVLVFSLVSILGAAVRESVLPLGDMPSRRRRWAARGTAVATFLAVSALLFGGWRWWEAEAAAYRRGIYKPRPMSVRVGETSTEGTRLQIEFEGPDPRRQAPLVPDHGRMMHLFAVREPGLDVFAHLHPVRVERHSFRTLLPALPRGEYTVFAQITYETGFSETLVDRLVLAADMSAPGRGLDPDDAWWTGPAAVGDGQASELGDGLRMIWDRTETVRPNQPVTLTFRVEGRGGEAVRLEPYLGMHGHLVVRDARGRVFSHLHPSGSFSMAAQQLFDLRERGVAPLRVAAGSDDPLCQLPSVEEATAGWLAQRPEERAGTVSFPYEFGDPGHYRIWVQVRVGGVVRTGAFDVGVAEGMARAGARP